MKPATLDLSPFAEGFVLHYVLGSTDTKGSVDTLKKISTGTTLFPSKEGIWQVFPLSSVGGPHHLAWTAASTLLSSSSKTLRFRRLELEWLARVAGTFQWEPAKAAAGITPKTKEVIIAYLGPASECSAAEFSKNVKTLKLGPAAWPKSARALPAKWTNSSEDFFLEKSALVH